MKDNTVDYKKKNILDGYKKRAHNNDQNRYPGEDGSCGKIEKEKTFKLFPFPLKFLKEAKRTLKPGGVSIVTFETIDSFWFRLIKKHGLKVPRHDKHYSTNELVALFRKAKFSNIHVGHVANSFLGSHLFLWYLLYPTPFRRICTCLPSVFMKILLKLDERIGGRRRSRVR